MACTIDRLLWWRSRHAELTEGGAIPVSCRDGTSFLSSHGEDGGNRTRNHLRAKQATSQLIQQSISHYEEDFWKTSCPWVGTPHSHVELTGIASTTDAALTRGKRASAIRRI